MVSGSLAPARGAVPMNQGPRTVRILHQETLLDDFFRVEAATVQYERFDGSLSEPVRRLRLDRGDSVAALVVHTGTGCALMVKQFKYPVFGVTDGWIVEVVAGMMDRGETPEAAIRREVREEIGYELTHLERVSTFFVSPGGSSERVFLFYGEVADDTRIGPAGGVLADGEDIAIREYPIPEALAAIERGEIADAKTIISLYWLRHRQERPQ
jgi:nudix-type nucleoside diphosphatase (YffH/AdpP family)